MHPSTRIGGSATRRYPYQRIERDLPELKVRPPPASPPPRRQTLTLCADRPQSRAPLYLSIALISAAAWGLFLAYATNGERANSSVVRSLAFQLRSWPAVKEFLGDGVRIEPVVADFVRIKGSVRSSRSLVSRCAALAPARRSAALVLCDQGTDSRSRTVNRSICSPAASTSSSGCAAPRVRPPLPPLSLHPSLPH